MIFNLHKMSKQLKLFEEVYPDSLEQVEVSRAKASKKDYYSNRKGLNFGLNYNKQYIKSGKYGFPLIKPYLQEVPEQFISIGDIYKSVNYEYGVTGFEYDYVMTDLWNNTYNYLDQLSKYACVCNPDYSMYVDASLATQISNKLRSHEVAFALQEYGIPVLQSIIWSTPRSYEFCFEGFSKGGAVIISTISTLNCECCQRYFRNGFEEMLKRISPDTVVIYGDINESMKLWLPRELDIRVVPHYRFERARNYGR